MNKVLRFPRVVGLRNELRVAIQRGDITEIERLQKEICAEIQTKENDGL